MDDVARRGPRGFVSIFGRLARIQRRDGKRDHVELLDAALAASEIRYRAVVDQLRVGVVLRGPELEVLTCNAAAARILGLTVEGLMNERSLQPVLPAMHEDGTPWPADEHPSAVALRSGRPQIDQIMGVHKPDGAVAWLNISAQPLYHAGDERPYAVLGTFEDVTDARRMRDERARERAALTAAQEIAQVGSWSWDPTADDGAWSRQLYRILDRDPAAGPAGPQELLGLVHPADRQRVAAQARTLATEKRFELEVRIVVRGEIRSVHAIGRREEGGCYVGTVQDVTESKQAENALRQAEGLLALSFDRSPLGMTLTTLEGRPLRVNQAFAEMIGFSVDDLLAIDDPARLTHPDDHVLDERHLRMLRDGDEDVARWEKRYLHADGHVVWGSVSTSILRAADGSGDHLVRQVEDITERKHREAEEHALRHFAELVARGAGSGAVVRAVAVRARKLLEAREVVVTQRDPQTGQDVVLSASGSDGAAPGTVALEDADAGTGPQAAAPIFVNGKLWGTIRAQFGDQPVPLGTEAQLQRFAGAITGAIVNAQAWDTLSQQATTDALTGLANSRAFHDRLRSESQRARRYGRDLSVVLFDVDHFKRVNDTYGHQVGDEVLAEVARRLGDEAREGELLARIGGEEFAWLIPEAGAHHAYLAADRVRRAIESQPFAEVGRLTVSAGVCSSAPRHEPEDLVRYADHALYWAKDAGRNTTFVYTDEAHAVLAHDGSLAKHLQTMSGVCALARAIDAKDVCTARHSERVADLAEHLALKHGWSPARARQLHACGLLHDVGKIGIPDSILLKAGALTPDEYDQVKRHAELGASIAAEVLDDEQVTWIRGHHERWDGSGYPDELDRDTIPEGAQLLAIADAWDVMTADSCYESGKSVEVALAECSAQAGRQFAPTAVEALLELAADGALGAAGPGPPVRLERPGRS